MNRLSRLSRFSSCSVTDSVSPMPRSRITVAVLATLWVSCASAQTPPNSGEIFRQGQPLPAPPPAAAPLPSLRPAPLEQSPSAKPEAGPRIAVTAFRIIGNRAIGEDELLGQVRPAADARYTLPEFDAVAMQLTRYYRAKGYFVARVYVPAQELDNNVVTLRAVEGAYGKFLIDNHSRVRDDVVANMLQNATRNEAVSLDSLERGLLLINETPGVRVVRADVMPGEQVGQSDFAIGTEAGPAVNGYVSLDNYGSRYTGKNRLSGSLDWNSPSGSGDRLSAAGMLTDGGGLYSGRLAYSILAAANGTRIEAAVSRIRYELGDLYAPLGATGIADSLELSLTTPLKRTRASSIDGSLLLSGRRMKDDISATATTSQKRLYSLTGSLRARQQSSLWGQDAVSSEEISLTVGHLDFRDDESAALDAAGARTAGRYSRLNIALSQTVLLPQRFSLLAQLRGQAALSSANLDGSERMSISGLNGVLAYPIGEVSGDHAALARLELSRYLGEITGIQWSANIFTDYGWARAVHPQSGLGASRTLGDVGLGLNLSMQNGAVARLVVARRVKGGAALSESMPSTVVRGQLGWMF